MKNQLYFFLLLILFYSCASTESTIITKDPSFNSDDFFNSSITVYPPSSVTITTVKYDDYKEKDAISEISNLFRDKLDRNSHSSVFVGLEKVPEYFRGNLFKKDKSTQFFNKSKTKYLIIIQQVFVGEETKTETMYNPTGGSYTYNQGVTKATMYIDIWNCENESLVYSIEVGAKVNDGLLINNLFSAFDNAVSEFIDSIKKN